MTEEPNGRAPADIQGDSTTVLEAAVVLAKHKRLVLGLPFLGVVAALVVVLLLPKVYTATARILPPQQKESTAAAMLGALAGMTGGAGASLGQAVGLRNPNELYAGILKSRTIADRLIDQFNLRSEYDTDTMVSARLALAGVTRVSAGRDGLITIEVDDKSPQRAAEIANAYVEELDHLMQGLAVTEASQRRLFFEKQLASSRDKLIAAELDLRQAVEQSGITGVETRSRGLVETTEQLRAQIAAKEIQLDSMRAFATQANPEAVRLRQEIASMKSELGKLEGGRGESAGNPHPAGLENLRKLREVKFLEFTVDFLTKQYEMAKIDEAKDAILIQVVDRAAPPDYKSKPKRALIVIFVGLVAGFLALLLAFLREHTARLSLDPMSKEKLEELRHHLSWR